MATLKHVCVRLIFYFLLSLFFFTGGLAMFVLAPIYKAMFAPHASWKDLNSPKIWAHVYKVMWRSISQKGYRQLYPCKLTDPPQLHNDLSIMQIKESWQGAANNCDVCKNSCCAQISCPMTDKNGRCLCYGSLYFGYFFCGRYPSNKGQAALYNCPKWEVRPQSEA